MLYFWSLRREFAKYFIIGFSGLFLDLGTLYILTDLFGILAYISVILNQAIVLTYNFTLNKYWAFRNKEVPHKQMVRYGILATWNYIFSVVAMYIFNSQLGYEHKLVRIGSIAVMVSWNFFLYKYWVYKEKEEPVMNPLSEY